MSNSPKCDMEGLYAACAHKRFALPSEAEVKSFESRIGVTLPETYREYILKYNGGGFRGADVALAHVADRATIHVMHGLNTGTTYADLEYDIDIFDDSPDRVLVIGCNPGNHLFLLCTDQADSSYGSVLYRTFTESFELADDIWAFFDRVVY